MPDIHTVSCYPYGFFDLFPLPLLNNIIGQTRYVIGHADGRDKLPRTIGDIHIPYVDLVTSVYYACHRRDGVALLHGLDMVSRNAYARTPFSGTCGKRPYPGQCLGKSKRCPAANHSERLPCTTVNVHICPACIWVFR